MLLVDNINFSHINTHSTAAASSAKVQQPRRPTTPAALLPPAAALAAAGPTAVALAAPSPIYDFTVAVAEGVVEVVVAVAAHCVGTEPRCDSGILEPFVQYARSGWFRAVTWVGDGQRSGWLSGAVVSMPKSNSMHSQCAFELDGLIYELNEHHHRILLGLIDLKA